MTCAQGLLRLLWGGPEVGVLRDWADGLVNRRTTFSKYFELKYLWLNVIKIKCLQLITLYTEICKENTYSEYKNFDI